MENNKDKTTPNDIVSPENTEKLYGNKSLDDGDPRPGEAETVETTLPEEFEGVDQEIEQNLFPSKDDNPNTPD